MESLYAAVSNHLLDSVTLEKYVKNCRCFTKHTQKREIGQK